MVALFLPFLSFSSYLCRIKPEKEKKDKKTAHNERRFRKNAYLCIVAEKPS